MNFPITAADALAYPGYAGFIDRQNLAAQDAQLFQGTAFNGLSYAYPSTQRGALAVGLFRMDSGQAQGYDSLGKPTGGFTQEQTLVRGVYGERLLPHLGWGVGVDYLSDTMAGDSVRYASLGAGTEYHQGRLSGGAAVDSLMQNVSGDTTGKVPMQVRLNGSYELIDNLLLGLDTIVSPQTDIRAGMQYFLLDALSVRLGRSNEGFGAGVGVRIKGYSLDFNVNLSDLGTSEQLSLATFFGSSRAEHRAELSSEHYRQARRLAVEGQYEKAGREMATAKIYGELAQDRQQFDDALRSLLKAGVRELGEEEPQAQLRRGVGYYLDQKRELARSLFLDVQSKDPYNELVAHLLALVSRPEDVPAPPSFTDVDPVRLKMFKMDEYFQKQQWDLALKECRDIIAISPESVLAYVRLGSIYYALGMKPEAVKAWHYAAQLNPSNADVRKALKFMNDEKLETAASAAATPTAEPVPQGGPR